ncbi:hypothetical protein CMI41_02700 [Candidatus Pacearchaeota archaeon]|nr:hypothetical protein [Candidatus Pacearchaeota archaeon]
MTRIGQRNLKLHFYSEDIDIDSTRSVAIGMDGFRLHYGVERVMDLWIDGNKETTSEYAEGTCPLNEIEEDFNTLSFLRPSISRLIRRGQ